MNNANDKYVEIDPCSLHLVHCCYWDREAKRKLKQGRHPLAFEQLWTVDEHKEHLQTVKYLKKTARPTIVIAASDQ